MPSTRVVISSNPPPKEALSERKADRRIQSINWQKEWWMNGTANGEQTKCAISRDLLLVAAHRTLLFAGRRRNSRRCRAKWKIVQDLGGEREREEGEKKEISGQVKVRWPKCLTVCVCDDCVSCCSCWWRWWWWCCWCWWWWLWSWSRQTTVKVAHHHHRLQEQLEYSFTVSVSVSVCVCEWVCLLFKSAYLWRHRRPACLVCGKMMCRRKVERRVNFKTKTELSNADHHDIIIIIII